MLEYVPSSGKHAPELLQRSACDTLLMWQWEFDSHATYDGVKDPLWISMARNVLAVSWTEGQSHRCYVDLAGNNNGFTMHNWRQRAWSSKENFLYIYIMWVIYFREQLSNTHLKLKGKVWTSAASCEQSIGVGTWVALYTLYFSRKRAPWKGFFRG